MKKCLIDDCDRASYAKEYCDKHYRRFKKYGDASFVNVFTPQKCLEDDCIRKAVSKKYCDMHYRRLKTHGTTATRSRARFGCLIEACNKKHAARGYCSKHYEMKYQKITIDDHSEEIINNHNGQCDICQSEIPGYGRRSFCIDHDHKTGIVRGMLCQKCNIGLGNFNDNPELLQKAIKYLQKQPPYDII